LTTSYSFTFEPNPTWSRAYSGADEIWRYFYSVYEKYNVEPFVRFSTLITKAEWDEPTGTWKLETAKADGRETGTDYCHVLINGSGALNTVNYPKIEGLETFEGKTVHSARWDQGYDLTGKRAAVIGTGARYVGQSGWVKLVCADFNVVNLNAHSAIQIVPSIQPRGS
jgi:cation diffusion facilitator CzcD-associated flavoprotein CzcO